VARKIEVQIVGDADSLHRALRSATDSSSKFGHALGTGLKVAAVGAGAAVVGLGYALKRGIDDFNESQQVAAQLQAVLKSTGGAANVTAKHVNNLAQSLSTMSGVDDEAIGKSENLLLTFRNIRNEAGKGNDIFDQATKSTLDLSVAMGEDLHSASLQVGKALNDPVKGLTALKRVGVQFTDAQAALIKHLVDTGHAAQAQKIILGELRAEFGGSAKAAGQTLSGQLNILKNAFDNAASSVIQQLLPYMVRLANFAFPLVVSAIRGIAGAIKNAIKWIADIASHFEILGGKSASAGSRIHAAWSAVVAFFQGHVMPVIRSLRSIFQDAMAAIAKVVQQHGAEINRISDRIGKALSGIAKVAIPILRFALVTVLPKAIGIAITVLDKVSAAVETLVNWFISLISTVQSAIDTVKNFASQAKSALSVSGTDIVSGLLGHVAGVGGGGGRTTVTSAPGGRTSGNVVIPIHIDGREVFRATVSQDKVFKRQNGRSAFA
jgi:phage-related protein